MVLVREGFYGSGRSSGMPDQIESEHEDPAIYDQFEAECARNGIKPRYPRPSYARR